MSITLRQNVRNYLVGLTLEEMVNELENSTGERKQYVKEYLLEELNTEYDIRRTKHAQLVGLLYQGVDVNKELLVSENHYSTLRNMLDLVEKVK